MTQNVTSEVLNQAIKYQETDESIGSPVDEQVANFVKKAFEKSVEVTTLKL